MPRPRPASLASLALIAAQILFGAGCGFDCSVDAPLDYGADANWLCEGEAGGSCLPSYAVDEVAEDGTITHTTLDRAADPSLACFAVYPTLDLRLRRDLHRDRTDLADEQQWVKTQAGPIQADCDLWAPVYRQATIGAYFAPGSDRSQQCFDSAYGDVAAAFDAFLQRIGDRPFALLGHSQGGMHLSRLIAERIEPDDAVRGRMVAAYPLGWPVSTAAGSTSGGSFQTVPICTSGTQTGCVVAYRSFMAGTHPPDASTLQKGAEQACVNPASPDDPGAWGLMTALTAAHDHPAIHTPAATADADLVQWPGAFEARCIATEGQPPALEVRWARSDGPPFEPHGLLVAGGNGSHILDLNLGIADVVLDLARRAAAR